MTQRAIDGPYTYFVTTNTTFGRWVFDDEHKADTLGEVIQWACVEKQFVLFGYCILPNHTHLLVRKQGLPSLLKLMNDVKGRFSHSLKMGRFWQPRFNFRIVEDEDRFIRTVEYIRYNFRKMHLVERYGQHPYVFLDWTRIQLFV